MSIQPPENNAIFQYAGRNYPRYAIQHHIHCVPVDEVSSAQYCWQRCDMASRL